MQARYNLLSLGTDDLRAFSYSFIFCGISNDNIPILQIGIAEFVCYRLVADVRQLFRRNIKVIAEFYKQYGSYTKSARKVQKQVNKFTEKYMNEMIKLMK